MKKSVRITLGVLVLLAGIPLVYFVFTAMGPEFIKSDQLCNEDHEFEMVITEGTLVLPSSFYSTENSARLYFKEPNSPDIGIFYHQEKKNTMEPLSDGYTEDDVKIYDNNGDIVKLGEKVRITGQLFFSKYNCQLRADKIEKIK